MKTQRKLLYVMLGGVLALSLVFGAFAVFAHTTGDADSDTATPEAESEEGDSGDSTVVPSLPWQGWQGFGGEKPGRFNGQRMDRFEGERPDLTSGDDLLAEALGVSLEDLQAAREEARLAAIDQAVAEGLLTDAQAEQLRSAPHGLPGRFGRGGHGLLESTIDYDALLADALGITTDALQEARQQANDARLVEMVDAGLITQEQLDSLRANQAVRQFMDLDGLRESAQAAYQAAYEAAVEQALADGAISQAQADEMLSNVPNFGFPRLGDGGFGGRGFGGRGFGGHGFGHPGGFAPFHQAPAQTTPDSSST